MKKKSSTSTEKSTPSTAESSTAREDLGEQVVRASELQAPSHEMEAETRRQLLRDVIEHWPCGISIPVSLSRMVPGRSGDVESETAINLLRSKVFPRSCCGSLLSSQFA